MYPSIFNDVFGPIMIGPSSSACAGPTRIGQIARGVCGGTAEKYLEELASLSYADSVKDLLAILAEGTETLKKCAGYAKEQGVDYMDLFGRPLVDMGIALINGYLFCGQASSKVQMDVQVADSGDAQMPKKVSMAERKLMIARRYVTRNAAKIKAWAEQVTSGDKSTFREYEMLIGPVPEIG